jgi:hypothetical protein
MQRNTFKAGVLHHLPPGTIEIPARSIGALAGDHEVTHTDLGQLLEHGECGRIQPNRPRSRLAVLEHEECLLEVHLIPLEA